MSLIPKDVINQLSKYFDHLQRIGEGGYSEVFFGVEKDTEDFVALKIIQVDTRGSQNRFKNELRILTELKDGIHLNPLRKTIVIKSKREGNFGIFVLHKMDLDLLNFILTYNQISEEECKVIFHKICLGVKSCHDRGIAHLDLKPDNVLLQLGDDRDIKEVQLCDFGFSRKWEDLPGASNLKSNDPSIVKYDGKSFGTIEYRALEIINKCPVISLTKADIWSLGVILFTCLTGMFPFNFDNDSILTSEIDLKTVLDFTKDNLCYELICKLLSKDFRNRPTIDEVLNDPWLRC